MKIKPHRKWYRSPIEKVKESKKGYNRKIEKIKIKQEINNIMYGD